MGAEHPQTRVLDDGSKAGCLLAADFSSPMMACPRSGQTILFSQRRVDAGTSTDSIVQTTYS